MDSLLAVSPVDGRYAAKTRALSAYFSEYALIKYRIRVEIEYFIALCELPLPQLADFDKGRYADLRAIYTTLTPEQALDLYRTGILPDAQAGKIGLWFPYEGEQCRALQSTVSVTIELTPLPQPGSEGSYYWDSVIDLNVLMSSANTLRWLKENLGVEPENYAALQQAADIAAVPTRVYG